MSVSLGFWFPISWCEGFLCPDSLTGISALAWLLPGVENPTQPSKPSSPPQWHPVQSLPPGTGDRSRSPPPSFLCSSFLSGSFQRLCSSPSSVTLLAKNSPVFPGGLPNKLVSSHQKLHGDPYKQAPSPVSPNSIPRIRRWEKSSWLWPIRCNLWAGTSPPGPVTPVRT